jgi:hypothetical protein
MFNLQRPILPLPDDPYSSQLGNLANSINHNTMGLNSQGVSMGSSQGFSLYPTTFPLGNKMNYVGTYVENAQYQPNDVVFVDPNVTTYSASFYGSSSYGSASLCPGLWIATQYVPPISQNKAYFLSTIVSAYTAQSQTPNNNTANAYQWTQYNCYYPVYPPIPQSYQKLVTDSSTYKITANQQYWAPLMPMFQSQICNNNVITSVWIAGIASGSYTSASLPYKGP